MWSVYAVFLPYIPESVQLLFTLTGSILVYVCTGNISPQREAICQKKTTYMKPYVNLPLAIVSWKENIIAELWRSQTQLPSQERNLSQWAHNYCD